MPKCHKNCPNCTWHVASEWFDSSFNSVLLSKVYRNYATHIVRVCVFLLGPINPQVHLSKSNLQVKFGSRALASLYELLCHHSLTNTDPLLEEFLSNLPTWFSSHICDYIADENSENESIRSINSSISAFLSDDSTYFSWTLFYLSRFFSCATPNFYHRDEHETVKICRRPRTTCKKSRPGDPATLGTRRSWPATLVV